MNVARNWLQRCFSQLEVFCQLWSVLCAKAVSAESSPLRSKLFLAFYLTFHPKAGRSRTAALRESCLEEPCAGLQSQVAQTDVLTTAYKSRAGVLPVPGKLMCLFQVTAGVMNSSA